MSDSLELLAQIVFAAERLKMAPSTLCQRAVRNGNLVKRLEKGQSVTLRTAEKIRDYIEQQLKAAA